MHTKETGKIFDNSILEKLTKTHIAFPLIIFSGISAYLVLIASVEKGFSVFLILVLFLTGLLTFSLAEYLIHRYFFHMAETTPTRKKITYSTHGVHHEFPKDKDRLAMPIPLSLTLASIFFLVYWLVMGDLVYGFLPGFFTGYASYIWIHYMVHAFKPPKNFFNTLWKHHSIHHYQQPNRAYGVSSPLWDMIFGTMPERQNR